MQSRGFLLDIIYLLFQSGKGTSSASFKYKLFYWINLKSDGYEADEFLETQYGQSFHIAIFLVFWSQNYTEEDKGMFLFLDQLYISHFYKLFTCSKFPDSCAKAIKYNY